MFSTWFLLSIAGVFALAVAELTQQYILHTTKTFNARTSAVATFVVQALFAIVCIILFGLKNQIFEIFNVYIFLKICFVSLIASVAMIFYLKSFKVKNISISTILISFSVVTSTFLGIIFFSESINILKFFGIFCILIAIVIVQYNNINLEKNHLYGLLAGLIFGIVYTFDKSIVLEIHPLVYIFWSFLMIAIWGFIFGAKDVVLNIKNSKLKSYIPIVISGLAYFLFNVFTFTAYRYGGEVGRIDAINNTQIFLIILFEYFVLKHTKGTAKKIISAIFVIVGIYFLSRA